MTPSGFREIFRYRKDRRIRAYGLTAVDDRTSELWVVASGPPGTGKTRKLARLDDEAALAIFLEDIEQQLRRGHWTPAG